MFKPNHESKHITIPTTHQAASERNNAVGESMPTEHTADSQPYREPSARPHPALKHLSTANHVSEVFKKRK